MSSNTEATWLALEDQARRQMKAYLAFGSVTLADVAAACRRADAARIKHLAASREA